MKNVRIGYPDTFRVIEKLTEDALSSMKLRSFKIMKSTTTDATSKPHTDLDVIAPLVTEFYDWLNGDENAREPDVLIRNLSLSQRKLYLDSVDDILFVYSITSPLRAARAKGLLK